MAREAGASVLLLEAAPREWRGGNSQHTRNLRCMHDAPQDVLVEAYPEEEFWQDLLKVTGGITDEALARLVIRASSHLPRLDAQPRRALPAVAVGRAAPGAHQRLLHGRRQGAGQRLLPQRRARWACRSATTRRWIGSSCDDGRFVAASVQRRAHRGARLRAGRRRLRVQPRLAARGLGPERARRMAGRQLPDPRHALQPGVLLKFMLDAGADADRRPDAGAHGGDRRARAAVRRRHLHAHRLRVAGHRGQPRRRSASTTRARTSGPSATRSGAGWWRSSPGRSAIRSSTPRRIGRFMPPVFPGATADTLPELARQLGLRRGAPSCRP